MPKIWTIDDPLQYAPPKPDGDIWDALLDPLLKKDKMQCNVWQDEVQNLLIFAGLFSSVVTAFIVESYKNLQPDPNESIVSLLAHIATRLDGPLDSNSTSALPKLETFSPTASSMRVNAFWFISLVLSLTTALVGIIALQWLREHQSYPTDLSPRERYALFIMRTDGLESWRVGTIFRFLPLLLQSALILFLVGVIDFLGAIGVRAVLIPVAVAVGLTLAFLGATTVLPALQVSLLHFNLPPERDRSAGPQWLVPPSQCPYRSPQAHAVRSLWRSVLRLSSTLSYEIRHRPGAWRYIPRFFSSTKKATVETGGPDAQFTRYLRAASYKAKWIDFDLTWLAIRDGYLRRFYKRSSRLEFLARSGNAIPISDVLRGLITRRRDNVSTFSLVYHAFAEISQLTLEPLHTYEYFYGSTSDRCRQSAYLSDLLTFNGDSSLSEYFTLHSPFDRSSTEGTQTSPQTLSAILHHQNVAAFIQYHYPTQDVAVLRSTRITELRLRLMRYFYQTQHTIHPSGDQHNFPQCLVLSRHLIPVTTAGPQQDSAAFKAITWQVANLTLLILQRIGEEPHPDSLVHSALAQQRSLSPFFETSGYCAAQCLELGDSSRRLKDEYHSVFAFIEDRLVNEMSSWAAARSMSRCHPSLSFYVSALFAHAVVSQSLWRASYRDTAFLSMLSVIRDYKQQTIDLHIVDSVVEERLCGDLQRQLSDSIPFSVEWWDGLSIPDPHYTTSY
ncbi:hypothetical protein CVT25_002557 [Psilocybe cyanescens]|uniref:DUF6535 domain-containing protein n=1 Tax=Psilocybe cyanescens TaxID=93625 RepID=A0A409WLE7_PSICY|nr:hypothetical protein CVT25_002557 [Psilocybe cyanescens]